VKIYCHVLQCHSVEGATIYSTTSELKREPRTMWSKDSGSKPSNDSSRHLIAQVRLVAASESVAHTLIRLPIKHHLLAGDVLHGVLVIEAGHRLALAPSTSQQQLDSALDRGARATQTGAHIEGD